MALVEKSNLEERNMRVEDMFERHYSEGISFMAVGNHLQEAEAALRRAVEIDPTHGRAMLQLGICLRAQGRLDEAVSVLAEARCHAGADPDVPANLGTALRLKKREDEALAMYDLALALNHDHVYARTNRAITLHDIGRWSEALDDLNHLLATCPDGLEASPSLRARHAELALFVQACAELDVDPALPPRERAIAFYRRGNSLVINGDLDRAIVYYEMAARLTTDYGDPDFCVGETVAVQVERHHAGTRLSCRWLESGLHFHEGMLRFCCVAHGAGKGWASIAPFHGGRLPIDFVLARRAQFIRDNQIGVKNDCTGCHQLKHEAWQPDKALFGTLIINSYTVCNMKCVYCDLAIDNFSKPAYLYMIEPVLDEMMAAGWIARGGYAVWGGGDPSVSREFVRCATKLLDCGVRLNVNTNALIHVPILEEALRQDRCDVLVSVDSGTPATFYRMKFSSDTPVVRKGRPAFDAVWDTIARYAAASRNVPADQSNSTDGDASWQREIPSWRFAVKYIFTDCNSGMDDTDGFIERCLRAGVTGIIVTPEASEYSSKRVSKHVWDAMARMVVKAREAGLLVSYNEDNFPTEEGMAPSGILDMQPAAEH